MAGESSTRRGAYGESPPTTPFPSPGSRVFALAGYQVAAIGHHSDSLGNGRETAGQEPAWWI